MRRKNKILDEPALIQKCKSYNKRAQRELYDRYASEMRGVCMRYAQDSQEAMDIMQEGFIKVFSNINKYSGQGSFKGWMKRVIVNTAINHYHKNKKHYQFHDIDDIRETRIKDNEAFNKEDQEIDKAEINEKEIDMRIINNADFSQKELLSALRLVPENFRAVFNLYVIEQFSHKQIAEQMNIDVNTSRSRLSRAKSVLQTELYKMSIEKLK